MKPRKNRSKYALKKYDYLYRYPDRPGIYYKRYSSEKRKTFVYSTGEETELAAYKIGTEEFDKWLGVHLPDGKMLLRDLARAVLATKESRKGGKQGGTYRTVRNQIVNHIIPVFGHLRPDQVTALRWELYDAQERRRVYEVKHKDGTVRTYKRTSLVNTRKYLIEILRRAHDEGLIDRIPRLKNFDPESAPPRYIPKATILRMIRAAGHGRRKGHRGFVMKLLILWLWKMGPRPGEALQYRWDMIRWDAEGGPELAVPGAITKTGRARTIPLNSKVARLLRRIRPQAEAFSPWLFPWSRDPKRPVKNYMDAWYAILERVGVDYDTYNLRDTFITDALQKGHSSSFIARVVDNSAAMIDRNYAVAQQATLRRIVD